MVKTVGKFYLDNNVFDESLKRLRFLYDEFDDVVVAFSGGKDSTVILNLCKIVAEERGRLPVSVMFLDQEAEWFDTIDYVKSVMYSDWVKPYWLQVPFRLFNSASSDKDTQWFNVWGIGEEWIRDKDPIAIHDNTMGTDRFKDMFDGFLKTFFKNKKACILGGVRTDESPTRYLSMTQASTYKGITWGKVLKGKNQYTFYFIYDWGGRDVWKAIFDNRWDYCILYNKQFQYGIEWNKMRLSSLIHENAVHSLFHVQEFDKNLYNALMKRVEGTGTVSKFDKKDWYAGNLPFMFGSWKEYRDYLLRYLITNSKIKDRMEYVFNKYDKEMQDKEIDLADRDRLIQAEVKSIITADFELSLVKQHRLKIFLKRS